MVDEIKQRVTVDADQAVAQLNGVSNAEDKLADNTKKVGDEAENTTRKSGRWTDALKSQLASVKNLVLGYVGAQGLIAALRLANRELEENARLSREVAQAQLDLSFLSGGNSAADLAVVKEAAAISGRSEVEISGTFAQFKSQTANLNDTDRLAFFRQLIETSLTTSASSTDLVELFSKGSQFVEDPQRLQNILAQTIIESPESNPAVLARILPRVLPIGASAGLRPEVTAGLLSFSAGAAGSAEEGATGLRNIIAALQGRGTPESQQILGGVGAARDLGVIGQLRALSGAVTSGDIGLPQLEAIGGRENLALLSALLNNLGNAESTVGRVVSAAQGGRDITRETLENVLANDDRQRLNLQAKQAESRVGILRSQDTFAQRVDLARTLLEEQLRLRTDQSIAARGTKEFVFNQLTNFGIDPEAAVDFVEPFGSNISDRISTVLNGSPDLDVDTIGSTGDTKPTVVINNTNIATQNNALDPLTDVRVREGVRGGDR